MAGNWQLTLATRLIFEKEDKMCDQLRKTLICLHTESTHSRYIFQKQNER